jgi:hypothetical protein
MIKLKNIIYKFISLLINAVGLLIIINAILKKDYLKLIVILSALIGYGFYQIMNLKVIEPLRKRVIKQDLFNAIIWIISIIIFITNFVLFILINNKFINSANNGMIFPSVYFAVKYWRIWTEDNDTDSSWFY